MLDASTEYGENIMRVSSMLRSATLALSLMVALGAMSASFAGNAAAAQPQPQQQQTSNTGVYDSPDFVVQQSDIHN